MGARIWTMVVVLLLVVVMCPLRAGAESVFSHTPQADVRLVAASTTTGAGPSVRLGLHFVLQPHWKIYWRSPGDAGFPPSVVWAGSENLASADIAWPAPLRFSVLSIETVGYEGEVVLPITATLKTPSRPLHLAAAVDYLICRDICIPGHVNLAMDLAAGSLNVSPFAHLIDRYVARIPGDGAAVGLHLSSATVVVGSGETVIEVVGTSESPFELPDLFVEGPKNLSVGAPSVRLEDEGRRAILRARVAAETIPAGGLSGVPVRLTLVDGLRAMEAEVSLIPATATAPTTAPVASFFAMLGVALVGGFVLNLMPCVLPVLSLKLMGLISLGGSERRRIRASFVASAAGILVSFLLLALAAVAVKAGGVAVGWGMQFQHPIFLAAMVVILLLFAANLWGVFEVPLPRWLADVGGGHGGSIQSLGGHFLTGAFATLLATPCSAPFLGTAIGFALARGPIEIVMIFSALGVGMASPYLVVAAFPGLAARFPRPGRWMVGLRRGLGVVLGVTAVWLLTVLAAQVTVKEADQGGIWRSFDAAELASQVSGGRVVLVDVTADWCVTCQVNKAVVINRGEVARRLRDGSVVAMRADWTRPSDAIAAYLASFGRYGIPFNAVYGPNAPNGIPLPELLTEEVVLKALTQAGG